MPSFIFFVMKEGVLLILILSCIIKCSNCCFRNFPKLSEVQSATNTIDTSSNDISRQYIFPELRMTCDTKIYHIVYKGDPFNSLSLHNPLIQLYRKSSSRYIPKHHIESYELRSVNEGDGSTTILTLRHSIELDDDDGVYTLGVFLPSGSSFHFERKPNATPAYYVETDQRYSTLSIQRMTRQESLLPLITMITDSGSLPTISSKSTSTSSYISMTRSSSLLTVTANQLSSTASTAVNTPMTTGSGQPEGSAWMYRVIIIPIVSVLIIGLVTGFIVVTCVLTYKLNKAKAINQLASRDTFKSSSNTFNSGFSVRYDKTKHQRQQQHNSMIINESYERTTASPHAYSILNVVKKDLESSNSTTCSDIDTEQHCQTNPSYVPSNPLPACSLVYEGRIPTCHQYEDPNLFLSPNNYECPQAMSSIEIPNYKEETII
ncbi:PREDICTED: uncharacterized protein LOC109581966 isoform X2 [Amphimedon queenslandica]|uniref:Uncharacterized protein n=1 Tax=Amphimedon queenslandica TaxID=400682 RepID=A0A1X7VTT0_AMPQE|nr:PREDICTED: uncharacterized protein LOC109581966 isoform X2 [Amphimedon queenslandica]|eukprot:XP_019852055.1 PREDICTED: uncharacterized protein LOC109581966 isoform X2 [Amphimedon queenslandica]